MMLRGYRSTDSGLLAGPWLPGELLGLPLADRPALAEPTTIRPPADYNEELGIATGVGFVRYAEVDWVHRRARVEIGLHAEQTGNAEVLLKTAVDYAFTALALRRLHGWVTPALGQGTELLGTAGFRRETSVPQAIWFDGRPVAREIWGVVRHG